MVLLRERAAAMMRNRVRMDSATTTRDIASYLVGATPSTTMRRT